MASGAAHHPTGATADPDTTRGGEMTKRGTLVVGSIAPVLYRVEEAAAALRLGRTIVYELIRCGDLRTVKIGTRRLVPVAAVEEYAARLDGAA
jgi:excisionase family DNA binding protein